jgi:hypothetical protein
MKVKVDPRIDNEVPDRQYMYSSTRFLTSALDGVGGQQNALAVLLPGEIRYPIV